MFRLNYQRNEQQGGEFTNRSVFTGSEPTQADAHDQRSQPARTIFLG